ncbi:hypothetical protein ABVB69_03800 [Streptomyces sp. NPDC000349]|uniref:hypothetical protein n=1 Tax=unclassified Streptomyces TaxID=2593676 RepID=UPI002785E42C|nr:hypothetical protein [Streptomyces sp. DSM 40167]MDQ0403433.1 hypothetical protein [Streptomyces sp. DSM 40167]
MASSPDPIPASAPEAAATPFASLDETPDFWFVRPPGFVEFDLEEDPEARVVRMAEAADVLFPSVPPAQKFSLVVSSEYIFQMMIEAGAAHVSSCLLRMSDDQLSQGTLCVMVERPETGPDFQDRRGSAKRTAVQWRELHPDAEVGMVMLPYGMAALCIRDLDLEIPGALFGQEESVPATMRQVQLSVPLKAGPGSVLFVFMTEDREHWTEYLEVLSGIMKSISDEEPGVENAVKAEVQDAGGTEQRA